MKADYWLLRTLTVFACGLMGCSHPVDGYCDETTPCREPGYYCDLLGEHSASDGIGRTCIPSPFDAGQAGDSGDPDAGQGTGLLELGVSAGLLEPPFDPLIVSYTLDVSLTVDGLEITPIAGAVSTSILVSGVVVDSGTASPRLALSLGRSEIGVIVSSQDRPPVTYTVVVDRGAAFAQAAYVKASNTAASDRFGSSVAIAGDTLAIGATSEASRATGVDGEQGDNSMPNAGAVYVFVWDGARWNQQAYLKASNTEAGDSFGRCVALESGTLVVSAPAEDSSATGLDGDAGDNGAGTAGAVYIFERDGTTWTQQAYIKASNTGTNDNFGTALALSGSSLAVGAYGEASSGTGLVGDPSDNSSPNSGAVYLFVRNGAGWQQQAYLKASNTGAEDRFGWSVDLDQDTLVVGAWGESSAAGAVDGEQSDDNAAFAGAAYVFTRNGTIWAQQAYLKASNSSAGDRFGSVVKVRGDTAVVSASSEASGAIGVNSDQSDDSAQRSGAVYVYARSGISWSQEAYVKASNTDANDLFGSSLALDDDVLLVGATGESGSIGEQGRNDLPGSGAAYLFTRTASSWSQRAYVKPAVAGEYDSFGHSLALGAGLLVVGARGEASSSVGLEGDPQDNAAPQAGAVYALE